MIIVNNANSEQLVNGLNRENLLDQQFVKAQLPFEFITKHWESFNQINNKY